MNFLHHARARRTGLVLGKLVAAFTLLLAGLIFMGLAAIISVN